ncbi:FecCD family ABC transporter permease [Arthrobacter alpinus]|nr:iron chelate uptake ABC transporter family permease subunit [Arthrobacter alpinus]
MELATADTAGTSSPQPTRARILAVPVLVGLLALSVVLSLALGANTLGLGRIVETLAGGGDAESRYVLWELRVPRTVAGLFVGAALGVSGALIQAFTRNPLADPGILGVNAGAAFFVALGVAFLGITSVSGYVWLAFAGALLVTVAVYIIGSSGRGAADPIRLTLAGVAIAAVLSGITTGMTLSNPEAFDQMRSWNAGTLLGRGFDILMPVLPFIAVGLLLALAIAPGLNSIALGEDVARAQGVNVVRVRVVVIIAGTLLAGSATAIAGPISFVGLMIPHVVRWLFGPDQRIIIAASILLAPTLLLLSDILGRLLIRPGEMPVGIVTAFLGAPVLIILVRRRKASTL